MRKHFPEMCVLLACLFVASSVQAADKLSDADKNFMTKVAQSNLFEIQSGQLAQKKTTNEDVRKMAARFVADHTANNAELEKLAGKFEFKLPNQLDDAQRKQMEKFEKATGAEFDGAYVDWLIDDHKTAIALFEKQVASSTGDVKAFAEKTLPVLREHLKLAQDTEKKLEK